MKILIATTVSAVIMHLSVLAAGHQQGGTFHPDSLQLITVSGTATNDSSMVHPMYYLDESGDEVADYLLNFGPYWYQPDSSMATRPQDGDEITIYGGLHISHEDSSKIIVVYEINGLFWREPYIASWNNMGGHHSEGGHHSGNSYAFGWMHDRPELTDTMGNILIDSTFIHEYYYLDTNNDGKPNYILNFGPPWYEPASGIQRPGNGQLVGILGGKIEQHSLAMLIVYEIDGQVWTDSSTYEPHFGGGWIHKDMNESRRFFTPYDTLDHIRIQPGWYNGMGHGGMMADSLFCQILELFPQNLPQHDEHHFFAGYEIGIFNSDGHNHMAGSEHSGNRMVFSSDTDFRMHYNDSQIHELNIDESTIEVNYWDDQTDSWQKITNAVLDPVENMVSFSSSEIATFFALNVQSDITTVEDNKKFDLRDFTLKQNYPNPFNPVTTITFDLNITENVVLSVYNMLGQKISVLINDKLTAGTYNVDLNALALPSGIYFYELAVGNSRQVRKLNLLK
jgi:hypothetical protein